MTKSVATRTKAAAVSKLAKTAAAAAARSKAAVKPEPVPGSPVVVTSSDDEMPSEASAGERIPKSRRTGSVHPEGIDGLPTPVPPPAGDDDPSAALASIQEALKILTVCCTNMSAKLDPLTIQLANHSDRLTALEARSAPSVPPGDSPVDWRPFRPRARQD